MSQTDNRKILTFSFDDGVSQDRRLIEILNDCGLKSTFNLNSEAFGMSGTIRTEGKSAPHIRFEREEIEEVYAGHEVAAHTLTHPDLKSLPDDEIVRQIEEDRKNLSEILGKPVTGFAYPGGMPNYDGRVVEVIRSRTGVRYARTAASRAHTLDLPEDFLVWDGTCQILDPDMESIFQTFLKIEREEPTLLFIWGHSYELDLFDAWDRMHDFCKLVSNRSGVEYLTCGQVCEAFRK